LYAVIDDQRWPEKPLRALESLKLAGNRVIDLYEQSEHELRQHLERKEASVQSMLEALTASFAARRGKPTWIEKTPNHLLHLV